MINIQQTPASYLLNRHTHFLNLNLDLSQKRECQPLYNDKYPTNTCFLLFIEQTQCSYIEQTAFEMHHLKLLLIQR